MSAGKVPVERIGNGGAKTPVADKLPSFGEIKTLGVVIPYVQLLSRLPFRSPWSVSNFGRLNTGQK